MTLADITRMLKLARVPRSKTVQGMYPNAFIELHVPATHYAIVLEVVKRLAFATDNIRVTPLVSQDVRANEHVYVKVKGEIVPFNAGAPYNDPRMPATEVRRLRIKNACARNGNVVVECASVFAL